MNSLTADLPHTSEYECRRVSGKVTNAAGDAVKGAQVTPWPRKPELAGGVHLANTDQNGDFSIADFGPGEYWVAAWEALTPALSNDPDFLGRFQTVAASVQLEEGSSASSDLKLIPREKIDTEMAKLR